MEPSREILRNQVAIQSGPQKRSQKAVNDVTWGCAVKHLGGESGHILSMGGSKPDLE